MRREGVLFHLFCSNANVNDEGRECLNLDVPRFGEGHTGVGVVVAPAQEERSNIMAGY